LDDLRDPGGGGVGARWEAVVRYSDDTAGGELPQLLNVIFGNTSIKEHVMVMDLVLSPALLGKFLGPRFGTRGLRQVCGVPVGPMLMTALKPMGTGVAQLAEMAYAFAKGGIDVIKDDHGLANQRYAPFEERVRACAAAVRRANAETGRRCVYAPCLNAPAHLVVQRAKFAKAAGAGAVLMIPGITGLDTMRHLAEDPDFNLPVISHPAILGAMLGGGSQHAVRGFSHKVLRAHRPMQAYDLRAHRPSL
jgi:ribulose-bisphosphate carboxylase large chain